MVTALMRPQWGVRQVAQQRAGAEIMIALDVSKSMLADDVAPNRLERAKAEIVDLLGYLDGDRVGLIGFAGRASVLSPLTPDFSFVRLVLEGVGPHSVARGGTRLEEPIRKAVRGFDAAGTAARVLLLITDGEDHGSFPLDAAEAAAEAGVRILAIGFGDEAGSRIRVRDPDTGATDFVRDADGTPVTSRLDGDLLRELALATGGAYVPAGTGVLDLESIYERHIAGLMRSAGESTTVVQREEGFQFGVLAALLSLLAAASVASTATPTRRAASSGGGGAARKAAALALALLAGAGVARTAGAQIAPRVLEPNGPSAAASPTPRVDDATPREIYNRGARGLAGGELEDAERWLGRSRQRAGSDGELRFSASYNLGQVNAARAETQREAEPEQAVGSLYAAADWFRRALELRPDDADTRHNLEVVLRRATLLEDELRKDADGDVARRLAALAEGQRELVARVGERLSGASPATTGDAARRESRARATEQRTLLADGDALATDIDRERAGLLEAGEAATAEDQMRAVQLENVLHYLHRARERMGQSRRQLRRQQSERAYRRSSAALRELMRAIDQLNDPIRVLDRLIADVTRLSGQTAVLHFSQSGLAGLDPNGPSDVPAWLTLESVSDVQSGATERALELDLRLEAGLSAGAAAAEPDPAGERLLAQVREARPFVQTGHEQLQSAVQSFATPDLASALEHQREALVALSQARERFLDLRGLIEAMYRDEQLLHGVVGQQELDAEARDQLRPGLENAQAHNLDRSGRLERMLAEERAALPPDDGSADAESAERDAQLEVAQQVLELASADMREVSEALDAPDWSAASESAGRAVERLEALRRLFFSIVEHLREAAESQLELRDETADAAALGAADPDERERRAAPLGPRQQELAERTGRIAEALEEQSRTEGPALDGGSAIAQGEADPAETALTLREAAEHVVLAEGSMLTARAALGSAPPVPADAGAPQEAALEELARALALLSPPPPQQPQQQPPQDGEQPQPQQGSGREEAEPERREGADPAQLLQSVRDREAERRRERSRTHSGYEPVEQDW
jgi:Ca-activated chloride channel family protein